MSDETVCEICSAELPIGDLFQCDDCGVEGCSACVYDRTESDGATLCTDCDDKRDKAAQKRAAQKQAPRRKK